MNGPRAPRAPRAAAPRMTGLEERLVELEERIMDLEGERQRMDETRAWFGQIVPPEARTHFKNAGREQLLGLRVLVDHWIGRLEQGTRPEPRETIPIE